MNQYTSRKFNVAVNIKYVIIFYIPDFLSESSSRPDLLGVQWFCNLCKIESEFIFPLFFQDRDAERTVGIDTDYIETNDYELEQEDKDFLIEVIIFMTDWQIDDTRANLPKWMKFQKIRRKLSIASFNMFVWEEDVIIEKLQCIFHCQAKRMFDFALQHCDLPS